MDAIKHSDLTRFIINNSVTNGEPYTHTSLIYPARKFYIGEKNINEFYSIYENAVKSGELVGVTEVPQDVVPVIVDLDFRFQYKQSETSFRPERYYTIDTIRQIIKCYQEVFYDIVKEPSKRHCRCIVLEKDHPRVEKEIVKDGLHLHFPYIYTEKWVQQKIIRPKVLNLLKQKKVFDNIPLTNKLEDVVDSAVPANNWFLYGSAKSLQAGSYRITHLWSKTFKDMSIKKMFEHYPDQFQYYTLSRKLSLRQNFTQTILKDDIYGLKETLQRKKINRPILSRSMDEILDDLTHANTLVQLIPDEYADDYNTWMELGYYLYNISQGLEQGLSIWTSFSMKSMKYKQGECETLWNKMEMRGLQLRDLTRLVKQYNPDGVRSYDQDKIEYALMDSLKCRDTDIAKLLYHIYGDYYICADIEKNVWYEYRKHRWVRSQSGIHLRKKLTTDIVTRFMTLNQKLSTKMREINVQAQQSIGYGDDKDQEVPPEVKNIAKQQQACLKAIDKLNKNSFKNAVMKEAVEFFYDEFFIKKLDENKHLTVFENGVYDSKDKIFRDGRPSDYCSKSTNINYIGKVSSNDSRVKDLIQIFKKTFVNDNLFEFFKQTTSDFILGGNRHKIFTIWNGNGDNGKSIIAEMLENVFGDYFVTPPTSLITGKQGGSGNATPELLQLKGARVVSISETGNDDILNCGMMKKLTGGDPFYARGLFKEPTKIIPQFKVILHCNKLPRVSAEDKASWNRIRILPFESRFVNINHKELPNTLTEQRKLKIFPKENTLKERLEELTEVFAAWLIQLYEHYGNNDLYEPEEVRVATSIYHKSNDFYEQFINECIVKTDKHTDRLLEGDAFSSFKIWYKESFPNRTIPTKPQVVEALEKRFGKSHRGCFVGYLLNDEPGMYDFDDNDSVIDDNIPTPMQL